MKNNKLLIATLIVCLVFACFGLTACKHTHTFAENVDKQFLKSAATCQHKAVYYKSCSCGEKSSDTFEYGELAPHDYSTLKSSESQHWYECDCGAKSGEENHIPSAPATATTDQYCTKCNYVIVPALGYTHTTHTYDQKNTSNYYVKTAATCETPAVYYYSCKCGEKGWKTFTYGNALGHAYGDWVSNGDGTHTKTCANNSTHTVTENCSGGEATETQKAICSFCHGEYGELVDVSSFQLELVGNSYAVTAYLGSNTTVAVPSTYKGKSVTIIDERAFYDCSFITSVQLPNTIKEIGNQAFGYCVALEKIDVPSCTRLNDEAFLGCTSLTELTLPDGLVSIGENPFNQCTSLTKVTVASGSISANVFANNTYLQEIVLGEKVTQIAQNAFSGCTSLQYLTLPRINESANFVEYYLSAKGESYTYSLKKLTITNQNIALSSNALADSTFSIDVLSLRKLSLEGPTTPYLDELDVENYTVNVNHTDGTVEKYPLKDYLTEQEQQKLFAEGTHSFAVTHDGLTATFSITVKLREFEGITFDDKTVAFDGTEKYLNVNGMPEGASVTYQNNGKTAKGEYVVSATITKYGYKPLTLTATLTICKDTYTITYVLDVDNVTNDNPTSYKFGEGLTLTAPTVVNYEFLGWYTDEEKTQSITEISDKHYGEVTLYAKWESIFVTSGTTLTGLTDYGKTFTEIEIPQEITAISAGALSGCSKLENITIPFVGAKAGVTSSDTYQYPFGYIFGTSSYTGGVQTLQYYYGSSTTSTTSTSYYIPSSLKSVTVTGGNILYGAFYSCSNLTSITIPESVTSIGDWAFYDCSSLTSIEIPDGVTSIGDWVFHYCSSLTSITFGENSQLASIGSSAFSGCSSLTSIEIPSSVTSIGSSAFYKCNKLTSVTFGDNSQLTSIGSYAFEDCSSLTSIVIPDNVTSIGNSAFWSCSKLTSVTFGDNSQLTSIGSYAFYNCNSLTSIEIPSSVTSIGEKAFYECSSLTNVTFGGNSQLTSIGNSAFSGCSSLTSIEIPSDVTSIDSSAFSGCSNLTSVTFGENSQLESIGEKAFYECSSLTNVTFGGNSQLASIGSSALYKCSKLTSIEIPSGVTSIGEKAFYECSSLTNVTFGGNSQLTSIGNSAFSGCSSLTSIEIPSDVTSIDSSAFSGCSSLQYTISENVKYLGNEENLYVVAVDVVDTSVSKINIRENCKVIFSSAFSGYSSLTSIEIPSSVTTIGEKAFYGCSSLTTVHITDLAAWCNIEFGSYDANPLYYAHNLYLNDELVTELEIPSTVTEIKKYAFYNCSSLTSIVIPSRVTSISAQAFYGCSNLTSVTFGANSQLESIGEKAFYNCSSLTSIVIPSRVTSIGLGAFNGCSSLEAITIPFVGAKAGLTSSNTYQYPFGYIFGTSSYTGSVKTVQDYYGSSTTKTTYSYYYIPSSLKSVTVTGGNILYGAFYNCSNITSITIGDDVTSIGNSAFYDCRSLTSVTFGENSQLKSIGYWAFAYCSGLTSITIPNSVTSIGSEAFNGCWVLEEITIPFVGAKAGVTSSDKYQYPFGYIFTEYNSSGTLQYYYGSSTTQTTYSYYGIPSSLKSVTVTGGNILYGAFYNCSNITSITIGDDVTSIGSEAFYNCSSLTSIEIPASVKSIGNYAFSGCSSLTNIEIPASVKSIGNYAFSRCRSLTNIEIPASVTSIGSDAFWGCSSLEEMTIPFVGAKAGVTSNNTYQYPFGYIFGTDSYTGGTKTKQYYYGSSTTDTTSSYYYIPSSLKSVTVTGGNILYGAFDDCSNITSITIGDSITSIGDRAFRYCSSLTIYCEAKSKPSGWNSNWNYSSCPVVWDCNNNDVANDGNIYAVIDGIRYALKDGVATVVRQPSNVVSATIPSSVTYKETSYPVTSIDEKAFSGCSSLTSIEIPSSVTSIGYAAFHGCSSLEEMTIPFVGAKASVTSSDTYQYQFGYIFGTNSYTGGVKTEQADYGSSTTDTTSSYYYIPSSLKSVTVTGGNILYGAFYNCSNITSITIGNDVTSIGKSAFYGCNLTSVTFGKNSQLKSIGSSAFKYCSSLKSITIPSSVTSIGSVAFHSCSSLTSVTFGENSQLTSIGSGAFYYCRSLTSIVIPSSVTSIGHAAFNGCSSLKKMTVPFVGAKAGVTSSDTYQYPFGYIFGTSSYTSSVKTEQYYHGSSTTNTTHDDYYIPSSLKSVTVTGGNILYGAFRNCSDITSITIPSSVTSIGNYAFYNCSSLTSIVIPDNVTSIGEYAFEDCSSLTSIVIPASVTSIGSDAFKYCIMLTSITFEDTTTWYSTLSSSNWENQTGGTQISVTNASTNAKLLTGTYSYYYWYKK